MVFSGDSWCDMCKIAIAPRNAMSKKSMRIQTRPLEQIFIDCIPAPGIMRGVPECSASNFLFIADPSSKYTDKLNVYDKTSEETIRALSEWRGGMVKKGFKMFIVLRTDAGSNFTSSEFKEWCLKENIELSIAGPKHQEQNAFAERAYGTASRMARSMLVKARLPLKFYHLALSYACKQMRVLPAKGLVDENGDQTTTYAILHRKKPRIGRFKVFGCPCVFKKYQPRHDGKASTHFKQLQRGSRGIFVGFPDNQAGWLIYVPEKVGGTHLIVSSDVSFDQYFLSCPQGVEQEFANSQTVRNVGKSGGRHGQITEATGDITNITDPTTSHWGTSEVNTFDSEHQLNNNKFADPNNQFDILNTQLPDDDSSESEPDSDLDEPVVSSDDLAGSTTIDGVRRSQRLVNSYDKKAHGLMLLAREKLALQELETEHIFSTLLDIANQDGVDISPYLPEPKNYRQVMQCQSEVQKAWLKAVYKRSEVFNRERNVQEG